MCLCYANFFSVSGSGRKIWSNDKWSFATYVKCLQKFRKVKIGPANSMVWFLSSTEKFLRGSMQSLDYMEKVLVLKNMAHVE